LTPHPLAACAPAGKPVPLRRRAAMPLKFPATLLPHEKIHRFHLARYGSGLVLAKLAWHGAGVKPNQVKEYGQAAQPRWRYS
jgi:hypothetical protein